MTTSTDPGGTGATRGPRPLVTQLTAALPASLQHRLQSPNSSFVIRIGATLVIFLLLDKFVARALDLPFAAYTSPLLSFEVITSFGTMLTAILVTGLAILAIAGGAWCGWGSLQYGKQWRYAVVFLASMVAWPLVTLGFNYYFGQGYIVDRLILVSLLPLILWRPIAVLPFLLVCGAMLGQLVEPHLGGTVLAHKMHVVRAIEVFSAGFLLHALTGDRRTDHIAFLIACLIAASYWLPAVAKMELNWISLNELAFVPVTAYAHGWLGWLDAGQIVDLSIALMPLDIVMRIAVFAFECSCLFFLFNRRLATVLLIAAACFHIAVFALMGFFFWTWIALDLAFLWMLQKGVSYSSSVSTKVLPAVLSVTLILAAGWWAKPPVLGWYDTRLSYVYELVGITADKERLNLHPRYFAPYEDTFTMSSFAYLTQDHAVLVGPYGVTNDRDTAAALELAHKASDIWLLEDSVAPGYREHRSKRFAAFVGQFVATKNSGGARLTWLNRLRPPPQFWSNDTRIQTLADKRLLEVVVMEKTRFYDGESLSIIRELEVARIAVPNDPGNRAEGSGTD